jgi:hypothetical protein
VCLFWRTGSAATAAWTQLGKEVQANNSVINQGASVALSADATTLAFGSQAQEEDTASVRDNHARVLQ